MSATDDKPKARPVKVTKKPLQRLQKITINWGQVPKNSPIAFAAAIVGLALLIAPLFIPDVLHGSLISGSRSSVSQLLLDDEVNGGLYSRSARAGDTLPSAEAAFIASSFGEAVHDKLKGYAQYLTSTGNVRDLYHGVSILKAAGSLKADNSLVDAVITLREPSSGFRLDSEHSATVSATFYALQTLKVLGADNKLSQSDLTEVYDFVKEQKENGTNGFRNSASEQAGIESTFHAVQILKDQPDSLTGVPEFVFSTQRLDGGFAETSITDPALYYNYPSSSATTAQGLYILAATGRTGSAFENARAYLRACTTSNGVVEYFGSKEYSVLGTYYFVKLAEDFDYGLGLSRTLQNVFPAAGILVLVWAAFTYFREQIDATVAAKLQNDVLINAGFLIAGGLISQVLPKVALFVYLALGFYTAARFFESATGDASGDTWTVAAVDSAAFLVAVFGLISVSPFIFAQLTVLPVLIAWVGFSVFAVSMFAGYLLSKRIRPRVFVNGAHLAWVANTVVLFALLYGRDGFQSVFRLIEIRGLFPILFVSLPIVTQSVSYAAAAAGLVYQM